MAIALPLIVPAAEAIATAAMYVGSAIVAAAGLNAAVNAIDKEFAESRSGAAATCAPATTQRPPPDCAELFALMAARITELKQRYAEMLADHKGLFAIRPAALPPYGSWPGHVQQFADKQGNLRKLMTKAKAQNCPTPPDAQEWATRPAPTQPANAKGTK